MPQIIHRDDTSKGEKESLTQAVLTKMKEVSIEEQSSLLAQKYGLPYIDLCVFPINAEDIFIIPQDTARKFNIALFNKKGAQTLFALTHPENTEALSFIRDISSERGWTPKIYIVSQPSLDRAWSNYSKRTFLDALDRIRVSLTGTDLIQFEKDFGELISLRENQSANTSRALEIILAGAKRLSASDIHIEPAEDAVRLRYRIDGVLQEIGNLPKERYFLLLSRIKMIGKMRLNIRKEAQDGHFFITLDEKRIDVRVNSIPGKYGENINMRLLSGDDVIVDVNALGLQGLAYEDVMKQIQKPNGLILNTGPTGSGKTTTLYTLLNHINQSDMKVITIEDPIEYTLPGIVQTEVSKNKDYTFATALRAVVRQDPDIILVGEIRDDETADITVNASLTGHLVLSTLHSNSSSAAVPRFMELGVKPTILSSCINALIGQRLVRVLCPHCKEAYEPAKETILSLLELVTIISPKAKVTLPKEITTLYKSVGCEKCHMTGYHGRIGIFEVLTMTKEVVEVINTMGSEQEILRAALENGMVTMTQDGILKALSGITTIDEVWRVADQTESLRTIYAELMPSELSRSTHITSSIFNTTKEEASTLETFSAYFHTINSKMYLPVLFAGAILFHAGDIHIEPRGDVVEVRFRIDGILQTIVQIPLSEYPMLIAEIKLAGGIKSGERSGTVDGRFSITIEKEGLEKPETIDVRISIILGGFGETVVMRILNQSTIKLDLDTLHIRKQNLQNIYTAIGKPHGVILNVGPTGSGKTTTLYSILSKLNTADVKIITVEDPIEYQIPGILQTQTKESEGYTFSTALRSLMRQNPNILMIGEIRDDETAQIAVQAASTGHLVLSTLHTNSASEVVSRLSAMGVTNDDVANAGNLFMAQRLVRRVCQKCKELAPPTEEESILIKELLAPLPKEEKEKYEKDIVLPHIKGCSFCGGTGYNGQMVIAETLLITKEISTLIAHGALRSELEEKAIELGMMTLAQDGILSVLEGDTTLEEIKRVTDI